MGAERRRSRAGAVHALLLALALVACCPTPTVATRPETVFVATLSGSEARPVARLDDGRTVALEGLEAHGGWRGGLRAYIAGSELASGAVAVTMLRPVVPAPP